MSSEPLTILREKVVKSPVVPGGAISWAADSKLIWEKCMELRFSLREAKARGDLHLIGVLKEELLKLYLKLYGEIDNFSLHGEFCG